MARYDDHFRMMCTICLWHVSCDSPDIGVSVCSFLTQQIRQLERVLERPMQVIGRPRF